MTKPKFRFEKPIIKSKTEPVSKNVLWYYSQLKKGLTINTIKEYIKSLGWVDLFDTAPIELGEATFTENGIYENTENGWNKVIVDVPLNSITITENGNYNASEGGWDNIIVEVPLKDTRTEYSISYISENGFTISPLTSALNANIISNIYANGGGIITFDNPIETIGDYAFSDCSSLISITIPNNVTSIGSCAFDGCSSLTSIIIPNSVTSIRSRAFYECHSLFSIIIPNNVTSIETRAFYNTGIYNDNSNWEDGVLYISNCLINAKRDITGAYTIKDGTRLIADSAFEACSSLSSVTIGNSVTSIGEMAFGECTSLTSVTIPNSVKSIGDGAFLNCSSLTSITIPNSVTSIGKLAFSECDSLTSITCEAIIPPTLGSSNKLSNVTAVYVPAESVESYKTATNWSYYSSIIQPIPES